MYVVAFGSIIYKTKRVIGSVIRVFCLQANKIGTFFINISHGSTVVTPRYPF
jgi:hypothetical protein